MIRDDLQRILSTLLTSRVRVKIINLFFMHPRDKYHMRKIARIINEQINAVRRELISLEKNEFLIANKDGVKKFFIMNPDFAYFEEFRSIFVKSNGIGKLIFENRKNLGNIRFAVLSHTYLNREVSEKSNPDMLIVGDPDFDALDRLVAQAESEEGRQIYYSVLSEKDLELAKRRRDPLIYSLSILPTAMIIGNKEDFVI